MGERCAECGLWLDDAHEARRRDAEGRWVAYVLGAERDNAWIRMHERSLERVLGSNAAFASTPMPATTDASRAAMERLLARLRAAQRALWLQGIDPFTDLERVRAELKALHTTRMHAKHPADFNHRMARYVDTLRAMCTTVPVSTAPDTPDRVGSR